VQNISNAPPPRRTGRADLPHPALMQAFIVTAQGQAGFPSSYSSTLAFRPLRSTVVTRFIATTGLSDSRTESAGGYFFLGLHRADRSTAVPESLPAERVIRSVNSFRFTRSARLGLAHQRARRKGKSREFERPTRSRWFPLLQACILVSLALAILAVSPRPRRPPR